KERLIAGSAAYPRREGCRVALRARLRLVWRLSCPERRSPPRRCGGPGGASCRMLTQCPNCRARARLSDAHDGTTVRCAECGRVFVARVHEEEEAARRLRRGILLGGLVGVLALIALLVFLRSTRAEPRTERGSAPPARDE